MKWTSHLISIRIGRSITLICAFLLFSAILCEKGGINYSYLTQIHNSTSAPIFFTYKYRGYNYNATDTLLIKGYEFRDIKSNEGYWSSISGAVFSSDAKEQDPVKQLLYNFGVVEVRIYRNDSLKVTWEQEDNLPATTHNFYNYNSWEVIPTPDVPDQTGTLNFYIEDADLE